MNDLLALADRVEALTGPCREIDSEIAVALSSDIGARVFTLSPASIFTHKPGWFATSDNRSHRAPTYTASIDAAMTLVPDGWVIEQMRWWPTSDRVCNIDMWQTRKECDGKWWHTSGDKRVSAQAPTIATALTAAALRAQAAQVPA